MCGKVSDSIHLQEFSYLRRHIKRAGYQDGSKPAGYPSCLLQGAAGIGDQIYPGMMFSKDPGNLLGVAGLERAGPGNQDMREGRGQNSGHTPDILAGYRSEYEYTRDGGYLIQCAYGPFYGCGGMGRIEDQRRIAVGYLEPTGEPRPAQARRKMPGCYPGKDAGFRESIQA